MPCNPNNNTNHQVCRSSLIFKGVSSISEDLLLNILEANFKTYLDWGFLNIGAWFDAQENEYTIYNTEYDPSILVPVSDPAYDEGTVWQSNRKDWVWETGCFMSNADPITVTGLSIDGTYVPYSSGSYTINYPDGRVIFNDAISTTARVILNHSYKNVQVYRASDNPWFSTLQYNSYNTANVDIQRSDDGNWSISGNQRVQLPAIVVESVPRSQSRPFEMGSNALILEQDVAFYVLAENKNDRNKLLDIIRLQQGLSIVLYNTNTLAGDDKYPLDHNGDLKENPLMYPEMVSQYPWRTCLIKNVQLYELQTLSPNFHQGMARATVEIISG